MKCFAMLAVCVAALLPLGAQAGEITISQFASVAPNADGSPSWSGYLANALDSLQHSPGSAEGTAGEPTYYSTLGGTFKAGDIMVTSFHSWEGQANPAAPFNNELGNRLHFGVAITDTGGTFDLQDVSFQLHSSDAVKNFIQSGVCPSGTGGSLCWENSLAGANFAAGTRIGVNFGSNGVLGGGDDFICDVAHSCDDTTPLNQLYYVGDGNAEWPGGPGDALTGQAALDLWNNYINNNLDSISNEYCVQDTCNTVTLRNAHLVPEPPSMFMMISSLGLLGLAFGYKRRSAFNPTA